MPARKKPFLTDKERAANDAAQSQRFIDAARELGCDESEERFNEALRKVAKHKPVAASKKDSL